MEIPPWLRVLRLLRLLRISKLKKSMMTFLNDISDGYVAWFQLYIIIFYIVLITHYIGCGWYLIGLVRLRGPSLAPARGGAPATAATTTTTPLFDDPCAFARSASEVPVRMEEEDEAMEVGDVQRARRSPDGSAALR